MPDFLASDLFEFDDTARSSRSALFWIRRRRYDVGIASTTADAGAARREGRGRLRCRDGLGRSVAVRGALAGARIVLAARTESRLTEVAEEIRELGGIALSVPTDLTDDASVTNLVDAALAEFGAVDAVVHNAFVQPPHERLLDADFDTVRQGLDINLLAALNLTRKLVPALEKSQGSVVMINSMVLRNQLPNFGAYRVQKSGLLALARSLSVEMGPMGIRVNSVATGLYLGGTGPADGGEAGRSARRRAGRGVRRDRGRHRSASAARTRRHRECGAVPRLRPRSRDHRAVPGRQLRPCPS